MIYNKPKIKVIIDKLIGKKAITAKASPNNSKIPAIKFKHKDPPAKNGTVMPVPKPVYMKAIIARIKKPMIGRSYTKEATTPIPKSNNVGIAVIIAPNTGTIINAIPITNDINAGKIPIPPNERYSKPVFMLSTPKVLQIIMYFSINCPIYTTKGNVASGTKGKSKTPESKPLISSTVQNNTSKMNKNNDKTAFGINEIMPKISKIGDNKVRIGVKNCDAFKDASKNKGLS